MSAPKPIRSGKNSGRLLMNMHLLYTYYNFFSVSKARKTLTEIVLVSPEAPPAGPLCNWQRFLTDNTQAKALPPQ